MFSVPPHNTTFDLPEILISVKNNHRRLVKLNELFGEIESSVNINFLPPKIASAPRQAASKPEPHSLLILRLGETIGTPDFKAICLDKYAPSRLDGITFPNEL